MGTRRWVVPAFYPEYFDLMCAWLPEQPYENLDLCVLTPEDKMESIVEITRRRIPAWRHGYDVRFYSYEWADSLFAGQLPRTLQEYELRTKLLVPHMFGAGDLLYTDDDIVVTKDPTPLLQNKAWWSYVHTDGFYLTNKQDAKEIIMLEDVFGEAIDPVHFNRTRTEAGLFFLPEATQTEAYKDLLIEYFNHPLNVALMDGDAKVRRRYRDQRFLSVFFDLYADGAPNKKDIRTWNGPFERRVHKTSFPPQTFIHYASGRHKPDYVQYLWAQLNERQNHG